MLELPRFCADVDCGGVVVDVWRFFRALHVVYYSHGLVVGGALELIVDCGVVGLDHGGQRRRRRAEESVHQSWTDGLNLESSSVHPTPMVRPSGEATPLSETAQRRADYALGPVVGSGSFGIVRRATHTPTNSAVVLKRVNHASSPEVMQELKALRRLHHPHVCRLIDAWEANGALVHVMPFYPNGDLSNRLRQQPFLTDDEIVSVASQLALALQYIHSRRLLHRDVKPSNVLLAADGTCRLADFGLARDLSSTAALASTMCGSPCYMAPEMWRETPYGQAADIWAYGCTLHECVARAPAFLAHSQVKLASLVLAGKRSRLPSTTAPGLASLIDVTLSPNANSRPSASTILRMPLLHPVLRRLGQSSPICTPVFAVGPPKANAAADAVSAQDEAAGILGMSWRRRYERRRAARIRGQERMAAKEAVRDMACVAHGSVQEEQQKMVESPSPKLEISAAARGPAIPVNFHREVRNHRRERRLADAQRKREEVAAYLAKTRGRGDRVVAPHACDAVPRLVSGDVSRTVRTARGLGVTPQPAF